MALACQFYGELATTTLAVRCVSHCSADNTYGSNIAILYRRGLRGEDLQNYVSWCAAIRPLVHVFIEVPGDSIFSYVDIDQTDFRLEHSATEAMRKLMRFCPWALTETRAGSYHTHFRFPAGVDRSYIKHTMERLITHAQGDSRALMNHAFRAPDTINPKNGNTCVVKGIFPEWLYAWMACHQYASWEVPAAT